MNLYRNSEFGFLTRPDIIILFLIKVTFSTEKENKPKCYFYYVNVLLAHHVTRMVATNCIHVHVCVYTFAGSEIFVVGLGWINTSRNCPAVCTQGDNCNSPFLPKIQEELFLVLTVLTTSNYNLLHRSYISEKSRPFTCL